MERDVFEIVVEKEFIALSPEERIELKNYCSTEEEYNQLKQVLVGVNTMDWTNPEPKVETKEKLDVLFAQTHPKADGMWYNSALAVIAPKDKPIYRQPLLQIAALALLVFLTVPFLQQNDTDDSIPLVAENSIDAGNEDVVKNTDVSGGIEEKKEDDLADTKDPQDEVSLPAVMTGFVASRGISNEVSVSAAESPTSNHPDGVFISEESIAYSLPASDQPDDVMDLLTTSF